MIKKLRNDKTGNTLVQIPIILAIIGGLSTFSAQNATQILPKARDVRRSADVYQVSVALSFYYYDHNFYPIYHGEDGEQSWNFLATKLETDYLQELPLDPLTEQGYQYRYWSDGQTAKIYYFSEVELTTKVRWSY